MRENYFLKSVKIDCCPTHKHSLRLTQRVSKPTIDLSDTIHIVISKSFLWTPPPPTILDIYQQVESYFNSIHRLHDPPL